MSLLSFDHKGLDTLAIELPKLGKEGAKVVDAVLSEGAQDIETLWRRNAKETAGKHGKHYPDSIDHERVLSTDIVFEIGPNPNKPQGGMSFEEGSVNQPPHLDGLHAADVLVPKIEKRVDAALFGAFSLLGL